MGVQYDFGSKRSVLRTLLGMSSEYERVFGLREWKGWCVSVKECEIWWNEG